MRPAAAAGAGCGSDRRPGAGGDRPDAGVPWSRAAAGTGPGTDRRAARPEPDLLGGPCGPGRMHADVDSARPSAGVHRPDTQPGSRTVSAAPRERGHGPDPSRPGPQRAVRAPGQGRTGAGAARPGTGRAEPPLLRHRQRDRRRGRRPERQPRQQRPGRASLDGRPLADGDLD